MRPRRHGLRIASSAGEPPNAAPTTEPENRQTFHRMRQVEPVHQLRIETWNGKPSDGVDDKRANIVEPDRGAFCGFERYFLQQVKRVALEDCGTRFPPMVLVIPIRRLAGVSSSIPVLP